MFNVAFCVIIQRSWRRTEPRQPETIAMLSVSSCFFCSRVQDFTPLPLTDDSVLSNAVFRCSCFGLLLSEDICSYCVVLSSCTLCSSTQWPCSGESFLVLWVIYRTLGGRILSKEKIWTVDFLMWLHSKINYFVWPSCSVCRKLQDMLICLCWSELDT